MTFIKLNLQDNLVISIFAPSSNEYAMCILLERAVTREKMLDNVR